MASGESKTAVVAAIIGNLVIAAGKFVAAAITGSSAMIAEGIHSVVDTGNGALLLLGIKQSARPADADHPFGHGKALYFWSLIVAMSIFGIGGGMSVYEGITHMQHPSPLENPTWNYAVLAFAFVVEATSFRVALREFNKARKGARPLEFIRSSKDPSLYTVVFEDAAALLGLVVAFAGVFFGHLFENPYFDGAASIVIGLILMGVAWLLAAETRGLLLGEGVDGELRQKLVEIIEADDAVVRVTDLLTMYMGPHDLLVNVGVEFRRGVHAETVHAAIHRIEERLRAEHPEIRRVYVEVESLPKDA
ncbi:MAG: cation diffusion facilitator family transporter [Anaerosomatales bacterium]|nr:cation diffusion facilitator family transporter [Anaerosomatales bacterium]